MQALLLLAGYGSRLNRDDLAHKVLLPFGDETLLSRHLKLLQEQGVQRAVLVVGHNASALKDYVGSLNLGLKVDYVDNPVYKTTGNTLSLIMGLEVIEGDVLILDGDVLYPNQVFAKFFKESIPSSFALVNADIDDEECAKVLLNSDGTIARFVTKRHLTEEERSQLSFAGEAIGFFTLSQAVIDTLKKLYASRQEYYDQTLWEILFSDGAPDCPMTTFSIDGPGCFEIDTEEDYAEALAYFEAHRDQFQLNFA